MSTELAVVQDISAPHAAEARDIYGTFHLGDAEFALSIKHIQEVVNFPDLVTPMPLAPPFLTGIFKLRGQIIPLVDLKTILALSTEGQRPPKQVAIVECQGVRVGISLDSTGEILNATPDIKSTFSYSNNPKAQVIKGALKLDGGDRLIQILDPEALISIEQVPRICEKNQLAGTAVTHLKLKQGTRKKCVTFVSGGLKMAFEINSIHEIIKVPEIRTSMLKSELCLGVINLRGHIVPVVNFTNLLARDRSCRDTKIEEARVIIIKMPLGFVGLLVESVDSIDAYDPDDIMPIPLLSKDRAEMFEGCLPLGAHNDVFLLQSDCIFSHQEILTLTEGHSNIYKDENKEKDEKLAQTERQVFITFRLNKLFGVPITEVKEIINYTDDIKIAPWAPEFVLGFMNLRGDLITIIDTKAFYNIEKTEADSELSSKRILVFQDRGEHFGLIVDSVESIQTILKGEKQKLPTLCTQSDCDTFQSDLHEVISVKSTNGTEDSMVVLHFQSLIERIRSKNPVAQRT